MHPTMVRCGRAVSRSARRTPRPNRTRRNDGREPVAVDPEAGRELDVDASAELLKRNWAAGAAIDLPIVEPQPHNSSDVQEAIDEFTTSGFAGDSGVNIKRAAGAIDGIVVAPGQTFSLNGATNPRNAANGYVEAGIIMHRRPERGVGGGVSQVATTLFNAAYFAGLDSLSTKSTATTSARSGGPGGDGVRQRHRRQVPHRRTGPGADPDRVDVGIGHRRTGRDPTLRSVVRAEFAIEADEPADHHHPRRRVLQRRRRRTGFTDTDTRTLRDIVTGERHVTTRVR